MTEPALQLVCFGLSLMVSRSQALIGVFAKNKITAWLANILNGPYRQSCLQSVAKVERLTGRSRVYRKLGIVLLALIINGLIISVI